MSVQDRERGMKQAERLIEMIYKETKLDQSIAVSKKQVEVVYNATIKVLSERIIAGGIRVPKLGIFERTLSDPRRGNDPRSHDPIVVPERFKVSFRLSAELKRILRTLSTDKALLDRARSRKDLYRRKKPKSSKTQ